MEYYSAIRKSEILPFAATWMDLEGIMLSKVRERQILYDITYIWNLKNSEYNKTSEYRLVSITKKKQTHSYRKQLPVGEGRGRGSV